MPVLTDLPPAPDELLKIVRCNCHTPFQHHIMDYSFQDFAKPLYMRTKCF